MQFLPVSLLMTYLMIVSTICVIATMPLNPNAPEFVPSSSFGPSLSFSLCAFGRHQLNRTTLQFQSCGCYSKLQKSSFKNTGSVCACPCPTS